MAAEKIKPRYRKSEGKHWIEVRVKSTQGLFDHRDPAPFREKDLDEDFVEYVYSAMREFPLSTPIKIIIYIEETETEAISSTAIREAIHAHFSYEISLRRRLTKQYWKRAQLFLLIGLATLALCLGISASLPEPQNSGTASVVREGFIIFGWVSIWKPIEVILFDWYPPFETLRYYKKLCSTDVAIHFGSVRQLPNMSNALTS